MAEYPANSHRSKELATEGRSEERKVQKVVSGKVTTKKNEVRKLTDIFISEDARNVKSYIFMDVLVPAIKKAISDLIESEKVDKCEAQKEDLKIERSGYNLLTQSGRNKYIKALEKEMRTLAESLEFEKAAVIRDEIESIKSGKFLES